MLEDLEVLVEVVVTTKLEVQEQVIKDMLEELVLPMQMMEKVAVVELVQQVQTEQEVLEEMEELG